MVFLQTLYTLAKTRSASPDTLDKFGPACKAAGLWDEVGQLGAAHALARPLGPGGLPVAGAAPGSHARR